MANPLDSFTSQNVSANDFRLPPLPQIGNLVKEKGLTLGLARFDELMQEWSRQAEKAVNDRIEGKAATVSTGGI